MTVSKVIMLSFLMTASLAACRCGNSSTASLEDSDQNRRLAAERYLQASPVRDMAFTLAADVVAAAPAQAHASLEAELRRELQIAGLEQSMLSLLVKHFTADELQALAAFYGSKSGRAASKKFALFTAEFTPLLQREIARAARVAAERLSSPDKPQ